jgi:hypothetical protein
MELKTDIQTMDSIIERAEKISVITKIIEELKSDQSPDFGSYVYHLMGIVQEQAGAIISISQQVAFSQILAAKGEQK